MSYWGRRGRATKFRCPTPINLVWVFKISLIVYYMLIIGNPYQKSSNSARSIWSRHTRKLKSVFTFKIFYYIVIGSLAGMTKVHTNENNITTLKMQRWDTYVHVPERTTISLTHTKMIIYYAHKTRIHALGKMPTSNFLKMFRLQSQT